MTAGRSRRESCEYCSLQGSFCIYLGVLRIMQEIPYSNVEQQIEKMKEQGLNISNEEFAVSQLKCYGYSNLIKSYRAPYIIKGEDGKKRYRSGVSFEQIYSLHELDRNLRNAVMAAMLELEEYIKEQSADVIAKAFGTNQEDYIVFKNYQNKKKRIEKYRLGSILDTLREKLTTNKDPICHYYTNYGVVPPWILFKSLYFGTIVNFIELFKKAEQTELMKRFLCYEYIDLPEDKARILMMDILFISMEYRNNAAHGGRMYDFRPKNALHVGDIWGGEIKNTYPRYTSFVELLKFLKNNNPYNCLESVLSSEVNRHCGLFPQDVTYLGQMLNIDIVPCDRVYVATNSGKFHRNPNCSGIKERITMEYNEAKEKGYIPCKRCIKS